MKELVILNKLEDINSLLKYTDDDFTPTGNLCFPMKMVKSCIKHFCKNFTTSGGIFNNTLMKMNINMMMMSGPNPLSESKRIYQTNKIHQICKFHFTGNDS